MIKSHLKERNMTLGLYKQSVVIDTESNVATFILSDFNDVMSGYQRYNPNGDKKLRKNQVDAKYFTHVVKGKKAVFGLEYESVLNIMFITEGVFKACRFHSMGFNAIAVLNNNPIQMKNELEQLKEKYITVVVPDPDEAGKLLEKYGTFVSVPKKPIDEMTDEEFGMFLVKTLKNIS